MQERTYRANRFDDALALAKKELGPGAMILSTRQISGTGAFAGRTQVEVVAVAKQDEFAQETSSLRSATTLLERRLGRRAVPRAALDGLLSRVRDVLGGDSSDLDDVGAALEHALAEQLHFVSPERDQRSRVVAFVGPTGVGKTTTIAKLAAKAALVDGENVALICMDRYKVGGVEQLERYADLIGVPMACAFDEEALARALEDFADATLVLIDTEGRGPNDANALEELAKTLAGAGEEIEVQLCLAASMREVDMEKAVDRMAVFGSKKLTITKLDEATEFGAIIAAQETSGLPLAYFTTGQRVPEDMEVATPSRLAAVLCGEERAA